MLKWIKQFKEANSHTRYFIFNWALYGILLIATTIYVYARLDYVRSTRPKEIQKEQTKK